MKEEEKRLPFPLSPELLELLAKLQEIELEDVEIEVAT